MTDQVLIVDGNSHPCLATALDVFDDSYNILQQSNAYICAMTDQLQLDTFIHFVQHHFILSASP